MNKKRYYIIGIGGVATGNLAGLLKQKGYKVAGSDQEMYEPMKSFLAKQKIKVFTPYSAFHVKRWKPDIVVVGNAISRGNPELEWTLSNGHIYRSVSDILREEFIEGRKAIVVTGTHGKTTTTALIAWILECADLDPTVFVGGFTGNFSSGSKLGKGKYIAIEGDEYDTAFFDKNPKFYSYRPYIGIVNNIELDHIDIYKNIDELKLAFKRFTKLVPNNGLLVLNRDNKNSRELLINHSHAILLKSINSPKVVFFGIKNGDYRALNIKNNGLTSSFIVSCENKNRMIIKTSLVGRHNISNILAAVAVARFLKISNKSIIKAISLFNGIKRRGEIIHTNLDRNIVVLDDYAHHPTAVRETLRSFRLRFPNRRIFVMFEPGSASSKRRIFETQYISAFFNADIVYIYKPYKIIGIKKSEVFRGSFISRKLLKLGIKARYISSIDKLMFHMKSDIKNGDVVVIMSCRGFDGLRERIVKEI